MVEDIGPVLNQLSQARSEIKRDEFADQILQKVKRLQTPEVTALFKEINERCKA